VLGYAQLLSRENLTERARRRLSIIETQIHRMGEIIQHYLLQTRGTTPKDAVLINDLVRDTLMLLQPVFHERAIEVTSNCSAAAPVIYGNSDSIQRLLINLLDNAMYACEKGGTIQISTKACSPAPRPDGILVEISDTGAGIEPELLPKIFDLFVTTKPPGRGTGLGLVICQEIVRAHGGTIAVESSVGGGTLVKIYLPIDARRPTAVGTEENHERTNLDRR